MTSGTERAQRGIQSIEVGGELLRALVHSGRPMPLKELARDAGMTAAKAHPYMVSFGRLGLIEQDEASGHYALGPLALQLGLIGLQQANPVQIATPLARLAVMEGRTLAIGAFNSKLDDEFKIVAKTPEEAEEIRRGMQAVEDRIARDMDPVLAASQRDVDELVTPGELRLWIESLVAMAYQSTGYRRVKNPRIWSLHDMNVIDR